MSKDFTYPIRVLRNHASLCRTVGQDKKSDACLGAARELVRISQGKPVKPRAKHFCDGCIRLPKSSYARYCNMGILYAQKKPDSKCSYREVGSKRRKKVSV